MNSKISIIIPVYNTEKYLHRCITSVLHQSYTNLEIICVDDGSTDGSGLICDRLKEQDDRIVVIHKVNGGESSARNVGLENATGDYIGFLDCDDWINHRMYEELLMAITDYKADMAACGYYMEWPKLSVKGMNQKKIESRSWCRDELLKYVYERDSYRAVTAWIWCKLFKRNILLDDNGDYVKFCEDLVLGGDILYFAEAALKTNKAIYVPKALYHYRQRDDSGIHSKDETRWQDMITAYERILNLLDEHNIDESIIIWVKRFLVYRCEVVAELAYQHKNKSILHRCHNLMIQYKDEYYKTNQDYPERLKLFKEIMAYKL